MIFEVAELAQALFSLVEKQKPVPAPEVTPSAPGPGPDTTLSPPIIDPKILELHRAEEYIGKAGKETFQICFLYLFV